MVQNLLNRLSYKLLTFTVSQSLQFDDFSIIAWAGHLRSRVQKQLSHMDSTLRFKITIKHWTTGTAPLEEK